MRTDNGKGVGMTGQPTENDKRDRFEQPLELDCETISDLDADDAEEVVGGSGACKPQGRFGPGKPPW